MRRAAILLIFPAFLGAATVDECWGHKRHGRVAQANTCFIALASISDAAVRAEGFWGLGDLKSANEQFKAAHARNPKDPHLKTRWGRIYLENDQGADAAELFGEALEIKKDYPPALLGIALVAADRFDRKAVDYAANQGVERFTVRLVEHGGWEHRAAHRWQCDAADEDDAARRCRRTAVRVAAGVAAVKGKQPGQ